VIDRPPRRRAGQDDAPLAQAPAHDVGVVVLRANKRALADEIVAQGEARAVEEDGENGVEIVEGGGRTRGGPAVVGRLGHVRCPIAGAAPTLRGVRRRMGRRKGLALRLRS
jgi:hypothetical protein